LLATAAEQFDNGQDRRNFASQAAIRPVSTALNIVVPVEREKINGVWSSDKGLRYVGNLARAIDRMSDAAALLRTDSTSQYFASQNLVGALVFATRAEVYAGDWQRDRRAALDKARRDGQHGGHAAAPTKQKKAAQAKRNRISVGLQKHNEKKTET
jgi:hypothetical protein